MDDLIRTLADGSRVQYRWSRFFAYVPQPNVLQLSDAQPTQSAEVRIQTDADFELLSIAHVSDNGAGDAYTNSNNPPLATLLLQQSGSGQDIVSQPVPLAAIAGDGQLPFLLPASRIWAAASSISLTLARYAPAGVDINSRLVFFGQKLYR